MTNEEKKAIDEIEKYLDYEGSVGINSISILYNLFLTQQKEIEESKQKEAYNFGYRNGCNDTSKFNDKTFIRIDKIKAKIEEYNKMINATYGDLTHYGDCRRDVCIEIINVLQSLLEEE